ncbi:MAG: type II/IV secretion system ATPase subunit, partial [Halobacteriales archaeon]
DLSDTLSSLRNGMPGRLLPRRGGSDGGPNNTVLAYEPGPEDIIDFGIEDRFEVTERYWTKEPYSFIAIVYDDEDAEHHYHVVEPDLTPFEHRLLELLIEDLRDVLIYADRDWEDDDDGTERVFQEAMLDLLRDYGIDVSPETFYRVYYYIWRTYIGYGKLDPIMRDPRIEDVSCDGYDIPVYIYHEDYQNIRSNVTYDEAELDSFVIRLAQESGKNISLEKPYVSGTLEDGSRIELTFGEEVTQHGSTFTIRKFAEDPMTPIELVNYGTFSIEQMAYLWLAIENNKSLIFAGGTASGKTTSMNAVSMFLPSQAKVVSIEDTPEINLHHENWVPSVTREGPGIESEIDMYTLLRSALRQRPEYIIVGEVRGEEALTLFQAMNTGHTTYSTLHAESVDTVIRRLENPPINVPRVMIGALDIVSVQILTRIDENRVRRTNALVEIAGIDDRTGDINFIELFDWDPKTDDFKQTGNSDILRTIAQERGSSMAEIRAELRRREAILRHLQAEEVTGYREFTRTVHEYYAAPDRVLGRVEGLA